MKFPYLEKDAAAFPHTANADAYAIEQTFDYANWKDGSRIRLLSVNWDGEQDEANFDTKQARDEWLNKTVTPDNTWTLESNAVVDTQTGEVKLPIPFDAASKANYLVVDNPAMPLDYGGKERVTSYWYWVDGVQRLAPSTTRFYIRLDAWQTYAYDMQFGGAIVTRGHIAVQKTPLKDYLANPMEHLEWLGTPDSDYAATENTRRISSNLAIPYNAGEKWILFATTTPAMWWQTDHITKPTDTAPSETMVPEYSDTEDRYGTQYQVDGYYIQPTSVDYSGVGGVNSLTTVAGATGCTPQVFAIKAVDAFTGTGFFDTLQKNAPQLFESILQAWLIPGDFITTGGIFDCLGYQLSIPTPKDHVDMGEWKLNANQFDYPTQISSFTKLYTWPYAHLEISDDKGHSATMRIETITSKLKVVGRFGCIWPYLRLETMILGEGANPDAVATWLWKQVDGNMREESSFSNDLGKWAWTQDIPTFSLWLSTTSLDAYRHGKDYARQTDNALSAYHQAMRAANTAKANTVDTATTGRDNTKRTNNTGLENSTAAATTGRDNTLRTNTTSQTNTNASADTAKANTYAGAQTANDNVHASFDTELTNANAQFATTLQNVKDYNAARLQNNTDSNATYVTNTNADAQSQTDTTARNNTFKNAVLAKNQTSSTYIFNVGRTATARKTGIDTDGSILQDESGAYDGSQQWLVTKNFNNQLNSVQMQNDTIRSASFGNYFGWLGQSGMAGAVGGAMNATAGGAMGAATKGASLAEGAASGAAGGLVSIGLNMAISQGSFDVTLQKNKDLEDIQRNLAKANYDAALTATKTQAKVEYDLQKNTFDNQIQLQKDITGLETGLATDTTSIHTTMVNANAARSSATNNANAKREADTSNANATRSNTTDTANATRTNTTGNANADRAMATAKSNADNTNTMVKANATRAKATADQNANDTYTTTVANSTRSNTTGNTNADASWTVETANAAYSRQDVAEYAAKQTLENTRLNAIAQFNTVSSRTQPKRIGDASTDQHDYAFGGAIKVRVVTEPVGQLMQAGQDFALYGYRAHNYTPIDGWNIGKHYTYWQLEKVWTKKRACPQSAYDSINEMLHNGITFWRNPDEIGMVDPFTNMEVSE